MANCARNTLPSNTNLQPIIFTENAASKVRLLIAEEGNLNLKLRLIIEGGGCSGFKYDFAFDETVQEDDAQFTTDGVTLIVDSNSYQYLSGATIDYVEELGDERFVIHNPNAKSACSCGTSFDIE